MEKWPLCRTSELLAERFRGSLDSVVPSDEEDLERRGSLPFFANRRGSRLSDIIQMQEKKKKNRRYKDKQGFTWRPFVPDEELPIPRAPHPHIDKKPEITQVTSLPQLKPNGDLKPVRTKPDTVPKRPPRGNEETSIFITEPYHPETEIRDPETNSLKSNRSENSFKTASSDPQINFIPRQVSDSYKLAPQESAALERKSSVRALQQQQYSALNTVNNNGTVNQKPSRTQNKSAR